jgi:hypothetical protein
VLRTRRHAACAASAALGREPGQQVRESACQNNSQGAGVFRHLFFWGAARTAIRGFRRQRRGGEGEIEAQGLTSCKLLDWRELGERLGSQLL